MFGFTKNRLRMIDDGTRKEIFAIFLYGNNINEVIIQRYEAGIYSRRSYRSASC